MLGRITWWNEQKTQGIILVDNGTDVGERYFLLLSKVVKGPAKISTGMYVKFPDYLKARRPGPVPLVYWKIVSKRENRPKSVTRTRFFLLTII